MSQSRVELPIPGRQDVRCKKKASCHLKAGRQRNLLELGIVQASTRCEELHFSGIQDQKEQLVIFSAAPLIVFMDKRFMVKRVMQKPSFLRERWLF